MPIGNQRDAGAKTCRSKRAYSFLICTRTLSNSALAARVQLPTMPVIAFPNAQSAETLPHVPAAFRQDLNEMGYVEGRNVAIEYRWPDGQSDPIARARR
jgi:hypothetical protein